MTASQTLFERVATPFRSKKNIFWVGENHDRLAVPVDYWINKILDSLDLDQDVREVLLFGRLLDLKGKPTYRGKDPPRVSLYVQTETQREGFDTGLNEILNQNPMAYGLPFRVTAYPHSILEGLDWVDPVQRLYPLSPTLSH